MLFVQDYLQKNGIQKLQDDFAIKVEEHPDLPLMILNYNQIESRPQNHPIVRECRSLVLEKNSYSIVSKSFNRFFNVGQYKEQMSEFNFSNFISQTKEDGSLISIYYYNGWKFNTRSSFYDGEINGTGVTWKDIFFQSMKITNLSELDKVLDRSLSYSCELVSPYNKVVRRYPIPEMVLLSAFCRERELTWTEVEKLSGPFRHVDRHNFYSLDDIFEFIKEKESGDPTFEGFVIRDSNNLRYKIKSKTYVALHHIGSSRENLFSLKNILPIILAGEKEEILTYYPEAKNVYDFYDEQVDSMRSSLYDLWQKHKDETDIKKFASYAKNHSLSSILFDCYRHKKDFLSVFKDSENIILKNIKPYRLTS